MVYGQNGLWAANGTRIETTNSIYNRTQRLQPKYRALNDALALELMKETAAAPPSYAQGLSSSGLGGSRPPGLGFAFGDSWARTQRGVMEFHMPMGQVDSINLAMRFSFENAFVAKALRLKTLFTAKGVKNAGSDDDTNDFLDQVLRKLCLQVIFRQAVWMYYSVGLVPILLPEPDQPFNYVQILDPRMVRVERAYGRLSMYLMADQRMRAAINDKEGRNDPRNADYYKAMPKSWKRQLEDPNADRSSGGEVLIRLQPEAYLVLENRFNPIDRSAFGFDGIPLQPYFAACEQYRMIAAGDFATSFLIKNIIAAVSIGDPKAEGPELYVRPDDQALMGLQQLIQNPNQAQYAYVDPTFNIRYFTPDPNALDNKKYAECKEVLKNLLPSPFWANDGGGSFAAATVEMQQLEEEAVACQEDFDTYFWKPIYERAAEGRVRIARKNLKPPVYDRSALRDRVADLQAKSSLYANGGLDIKTLIAEHGYDPDVIHARLKDQMGDVKKGIFTPAFEAKQGIVAAKTYGINKLSGSGSDDKGGHPTKPGSKPQAESQTGRTPRASEKGK